MRVFFIALLAALCAGGLHAQVSAPATSAQAEKDLQEIRRLVEEGAFPRARLIEAEEQFQDAQDQAILDQQLAEGLTLENITETQGQELLAAAERRLERQTKRFERVDELVKSGVLPSTALVEPEAELARTRRTHEVVTKLREELLQIVEMAHQEQEAISLSAQLGGPVAEKFTGSGLFRPRQLTSIRAAFEKEFGRNLPISAHGQTAVHQAMGFDHRNRVDVALNPDEPEGVWLREFLRNEKIPYFAFRAAIPGKSTAPHIHIGPPSGPLRASAAQAASRPVAD
jgi:hypothetical protein